MRRVSLVMTSFLLLLVACKKDESPTNSNNTPPSDFTPLPLAVGNTWVYTQSGGSDVTYTLSDTTISSLRIYRMPDDNIWFDVDKDGFYYQDGILYGLKLSPATAAQVAFPKNPTVGQTWRIKDYEMKLESTSEQVTVQAGTFSCYKVSARETTATSIKFDSWWSTGKGIVKLQSRIGSDLRELKSVVLH